ncbi:DUF6017 domain-containing protein [Holdemania massiliensis]|uniref:DUF6017 domain-containing protein n=1 Tax=Holdemania massiliensis TaxID=1468449 RepID=UPI0003015D69|nr:DUF6017 domain-containing protein [Holdemania massiliensis]
MLDEIERLILDTACSSRKTIRIAGDDYLAEVGKIPFFEAGQSTCAVCDVLHEGQYHLCQRYHEMVFYITLANISSYYSTLV